MSIFTLNRSTSRLCSLTRLIRAGLVMSIVLTGLTAGAAAQTYTNPASLGIPDIGNATLYPSPIIVTDGPASIGSIKVTLHNVTHGWPQTCVISLQAPNGQTVVLTQGTGGTSTVSNLELSFGQAQVASTVPPSPWVSGTFLPTGGWGNIAGSNANGTWNLLVHQNFGHTGIGGSIQGGWSLSLGTDKGLFNVDFNSGGGTTQSGAGLIGATGDTWNAMPAHAGSEPAHPLATSFNGVSNVTLAYSGATGSFDDTNNSFNATPFANLMRDYLIASQGNTATLTFAGLAPNAPYDLILYSNPNQDRVRASQFTVNGAAQTASSIGNASTFIPGINYVRFPSAQADATGNLAVAMTFQAGQGNLEADLNGLQIQPAPLTVAGEYCSLATPIGNGTVFFTTIGATTDGPPENHIGFGFGDNQINGDVWFLYTASCTGTATASLCGSNFDTKIAIYNGATCPTGPDTAIAGNDDFCGLQSSTSFSCTAGHQYLVRVGGFTTSRGSAKLVMSCDGSACLTADVGVQGGLAGHDGQLDNNDFIAFINAFFAHTTCP